MLKFPFFFFLLLHFPPTPFTLIFFFLIFLLLQTATALDYLGLRTQPWNDPGFSLKNLTVQVRPCEWHDCAAPGPVHRRVSRGGQKGPPKVAATVCVWGMPVSWPSLHGNVKDSCSESITNNSSFLLKKTSMKLKKERKNIKNKTKQKQKHNQVKKNRFSFRVFIYQILSECPLCARHCQGYWVISGQ